MSAGVNQHIRVISINNSTTTLLNVDEVFTGASDDVGSYDAISVAIKANLDSAPDGVEFQFSDDETMWYTARYMTYDKDIIFFRTISVKKRYFRIRYTNIDEAQTKFRIQTVLLKDKDDTDDTSFMLNTQHIDQLGNIKTANDSWDVLCDVKHISTQDRINTSVYTSGSGSESHSSVNGSLKLSVSRDGDAAINQTKTYYPIINGKRLRIFITCILNAQFGGNKIGSHSRIGFFDDKNGIYLDYDGRDFSLVLRKINNASSIVTTTVGRYAWNIDSLDGEGISDIVMEPSNLTTYFFEFSSYDRCDIKFGVVVNGRMYYAHSINLSDTTVPMLQTTNLPVRCEIVTNSNGDASMGISTITILGESKYRYKGVNYNVFSDSESVITNEFERVVASIRTVVSTSIASPILIPIKCALSCSDDAILVKYSIYAYKGMPASMNLLTTTKGEPSSFVTSESGNASYRLAISDLIDAECDTYRINITSGFFKEYKEINLYEMLERSKLITLSKNILNSMEYIVITCKSVGVEENYINAVSIEWEEIL
jgi:hypothetical protein